MYSRVSSFLFNCLESEDSNEMYFQYLRKILRLSNLRIFLSIFIHSIAVEGKMEFMSHFKRRNIFDISCNLLDTEIILRKYAKDCLLKILKHNRVFNTIVFFRDILILNLGSSTYSSLLQMLNYTEFSKFL